MEYANILKTRRKNAVKEEAHNLLKLTIIKRDDENLNGQIQNGKNQ